MAEGHHEIVIVKRHGDHEDGHHGGAWKIALADFMTAMMALFLVMWLINSTSKEQKRSIAEYFNPVKLAEVTHDRKGVSDPKDEPSDKPGTGAGKEGEGKGEGAGAGKAADRPADRSPPGPPGSRARESALFQDPYAVLAKLAVEAEHSDIGSVDAAAQDSGVPGVAGGEAARDPFDPLYWQTEALPRARSERPGAVNTVATAKDEIRLDARAQSLKDGLKDPAKPVPGAAGDEALPAAVRNVLAPARTKAPDKPAEVKESPKQPATETPKDAPAKDIAEPPADTAALTEIKTEIAKALQPLGTGAPAPRIEVRRTGEGVLVSVTDEINFSMFPIGSAEPSPKVVRALERIAKVLNTHPGQIVVRGHTDGRPFRSETYDNWRLSSARAQMAFYMLARAGLDERRLDRIEGYGDRQPRNSDPKAAENRRIEILLRSRPE